MILKLCSDNPPFPTWQRCPGELAEQPDESDGAFAGQHIKGSVERFTKIPPTRGIQAMSANVENKTKSHVSLTVFEISSQTFKNPTTFLFQ